MGLSGKNLFYEGILVDKQIFPVTEGSGGAVGGVGIFSGDNRNVPRLIGADLLPENHISGAGAAISDLQYIMEMQVVDSFSVFPNPAGA